VPAPVGPQRQPEKGGAEEQREKESEAHAEDSGGEPLLDLLLDFAGLWKAAQPFLREDQVGVDGDLEDATAATDQLRGEAEPGFDLSRQTGGAGVVVSARAVLDGNVLRGHEVLLSRLDSSSRRSAAGGRTLLQNGMKRLKTMLARV
jgi:hypothetical protein